MIYLSKIVEFKLVKGDTKWLHTRTTPSGQKLCILFWIGDAIKSYKNSIVGYEYDGNIRGKCTKKNGAAAMACCSCRNYAPSPEAERLL